MKGGISVEGKTAENGSLVVFDRDGDGIEIVAKSDVHYLFMGGQPIDEPIVGQGPFVMNSREQIVEAYQDFQNGKMGVLD